jgi:hypothetical protein
MGVDRSLHIRSLSEAARQTAVEEQDEVGAGPLRIIQSLVARGQNRNPG